MRLQRFFLAGALLALLGCSGSAGEVAADARLPVRLLAANGLEWPRDAANDLRYALALVPGAIFGTADRASLQQLTIDRAHLELDVASRAAWAGGGARPWAAVNEAVRVEPSDARLARVMLAAFDGRAGSNFGVGMHDLAARNNLVVVYVDRPCTLRSDAAALPGAGVQYALEFPRAGFYWVRTAPGEPVTTVTPDVPTVEVRVAGG